MQVVMLINLISLIVGSLMVIKPPLLFLSAVLAALILIILKTKNKYILILSSSFVLLGYSSTYISKNFYTNKYEELKAIDKYSGYILEEYDNLLVIKNYQDGYKIKGYVDESSDVKVGDYIVFRGSFREMMEKDKLILFSSGYNGRVNIQLDTIEKINKNNIRILPSKIKYKIINALQDVDKEAGSFVAGLILGYRNYDENSRAFDELGISHILAVSGFNLGIIYYFINKAFDKIQARVKYSSIIIISFIYTALSGFEVSILRAFIMILFLVIAKLLKRPYDNINIIFITALIMLIINPFYIINAGFILSFLATLGIICFGEKIEDKLPDKLNLIKQELAVTLAAFISTLPVVIFYNGEVSLLTILVNVLISPIIALITISGFILATLFLIIKTNIIFYPIVFLGLLFIKIINFISKINLVLNIGPLNFAIIIIYYLTILVAFRFIKLNLNQRRIYYSGLLIIIGLIFVYNQFNKPLKIHFINVGQGDSIFIETPNKKGILIDTGPSYEGSVAAQYRIVPYLKRNGYYEIKMLFITHFHTDHSGGLDFIKDNIKVENFYTHSYKGAKGNFIGLEKGDKLSIDGVEIRVLSPDDSAKDKESGNDTSLVLYLKYKDFDLLLTGDAEGKILDEINNEFEIIKIPHHGAASSLSKLMMDSSSFEVGVICVGKNGFGHPSDLVIETFAENNIDIYRTDKHGNIVIRTNGKTYSIKHD